MGELILMPSGAKKCKSARFFMIFAKSRITLKAVKFRPSDGSWNGRLLVKAETILHQECRGFEFLGFHLVPLNCARSKKKWLKKESRRAILRNLTPTKKRKNSQKVFGSGPCLCWGHMPSLVELGCFGGLPEPFECTAPVLGWLPPLLALWILGLPALKLT